MKQALLNSITNDIAILQELTFTDIDDSKTSEELLLLLVNIKELIDDFDDVHELVKMYDNLKVPIKLLLTDISE